MRCRLTFVFISENLDMPPKTDVSTWNSRFQKARTKVRAFAFVGLQSGRLLILSAVLALNDFR